MKDWPNEAEAAREHRAVVDATLSATVDLLKSNVEFLRKGHKLFGGPAAEIADHVEWLAKLIGNQISQPSGGVAPTAGGQASSGIPTANSQGGRDPADPARVFYADLVSDRAETVTLPASTVEKVRVALESVTEGMDAAGGDGYGMPECPWCGADGTKSPVEHGGACRLLDARAALAALPPPTKESK